MAKLTLSLFGPGILSLEGRAIRLHSSKALALLAYLAVEAERPHSRSKLANLLWSDRPAVAARQSLRQALYSLKSVADGLLDGCLEVDQEVVRFVPAPLLEVDAHAFLSNPPGPPPGEFLEGIALAGCEEFEQWLAATRERLAAIGGRANRVAILDPGEVESLVRAARAAERVYAFGHAIELYDAALRVLRKPAPGSGRYAEVLLLKEAALERLGRRGEQAETIEQAIRAVAALGDPARLAAVLLRKAGVCAYLGKEDEALDAAQRALDIYRRVADRPGEAEALRELGFAHWRAGNHSAALDFSRQALELHRRLGDVVGEATALHNLAEVHRALGSPRQALQWYEQALALHWSVRNHEGEILTLFGMANALHQAGDPARSRKRYEDALALSRQHHERTMESRALHALAMLYAAEKDLDLALKLMESAVEVDRSIGYAHALGHDLVDLAHIHAIRTERAQSRAALQEALVWFRYTEDADALSMARRHLASIDAGGTLSPSPLRQGIKSHLALGEGKVYCEFESPLGRLRRL